MNAGRAAGAALYLRRSSPRRTKERTCSQHLGLEPAKDDPGLLAVHNWMLAEFESGRQTSIEWEEIEPVVKRHLLRAQMEHPTTA